MKNLRKVMPTFLFAITTLTTSGAQERSAHKSISTPTLESLQGRYIGKTLVLQAVGYNSWQGGPVHTGDIATVKSVSLHDQSPVLASHPNAFGETDFSDKAPDPYVDITVTLPDGSERYTTGYAKNFCCERDLFQLKYVAFRITTPQTSHKEAIEKMLPSTVGRNLFALRESELLDPSSTRDEVLGHLATKIDIKGKDLLMKPLRITHALYDEPSDHVLFELALPNGQKAIAMSSFVEEGPDAPFLEKIEGTLFAAPPTCFSQIDLKALRSLALYHGVSRVVVDELYGQPEQENDWGSGGTQLVYYRGSVMIYLNGSDKVTDWQSLDR